MPSPSKLKHEFRNYWRKHSVTVFLLCGIDMSREPFKHPGSCGTSTTCATTLTCPSHPSPCPTSWQLRNINNVCNVQGTLTCPTPPQPLPHILAAAEHQQRVQRTRNVNMPHPTPAPAPHPGSCGTSTTCAMYKER